MKSIPMAFAWEFLEHGKWLMLVGFAQPLLLPLFILAALPELGTSLKDTSISIMLHVFFTLLGMFLVAVCVVGSREPVTRLGALPVSSRAIVFWYMVMSMVAMVTLFGASLLTLRAVYQADWPLLGPVLFGMTMVAGFQVAIWQREHSIGQFVCWFGGMLLFGFWYLWRHSALAFGNFMWPKGIQYWHDVTLLDSAMMLTVIAGSFFVGLRSVAQVRCGETYWKLNLSQWLEKRSYRSAQALPRFSSWSHAHQWYQWQQVGRYVYFCFIACGIMMSVGWLLDNRESYSLFNGLVVSGGMISLLAIGAGIIFAFHGTKDTYGMTNFDLELGNYLATRPKTSTSIAHCVLRSLTKTLLLIWLTWAAVFAFNFTIAWILGWLPNSLVPNELGWWYLPGTVVSLLAAGGVGVSVSLTGRLRLVLGLFGFVFGYVLLTALLEVNRLISKESMSQISAILFGVVGTFATLSALYLACKNSLISARQAVVYCCVWAILEAVVVFEWITIANRQLPAYAIAIGLISLAILPWPATPLAFAYNRVR